MTKQKIEISDWDPSEDIKTTEDAIAYFEAALEEKDTELLLAVLGDIARSKGLAELTDNNPSFVTVVQVLEALGFRLSLQQKTVA